MSEFSHLDGSCQPSMVDVSAKETSTREALAEGFIRLGATVIERLENGEIGSPKGPLIQTAIIAGTMAVKKTAELIPFCHPLPIEKCQFEIVPEGAEQLRVRCRVRTSARTGVEMEALQGVSAAVLALWDMTKSVNPALEIGPIRLLEKTGGKADFRHPGAEAEPGS